MIIAIDGPAGSGKSTVSKMVAEKLGILYVDTGAIYRAITLKAMRKHLNFEEKDKLIDLAKKTKVELQLNKKSELIVLLDDKDVTKKIRTSEVTRNVKFIAGVAGVRKEMAEMQRRIAKNGKGAVLEGRDIGTVVFPDADKKFYLDADFKERVRRRHKELVGGGEVIDFSSVEEDVSLRDKSDINREVAPLKKADDAVTIDTTSLTIEETAEKILSCIQ